MVAVGPFPLVVLLRVSVLPARTVWRRMNDILPVALSPVVVGIRVHNHEYGETEPSGLRSFAANITEWNRQFVMMVGGMPDQHVPLPRLLSAGDHHSGGSER